jgi:hypothetical protein
MSRVIPAAGYYYWYCCDAVRIRFCGTAAANGLIVRPTYDTHMNIEQRWNDTRQNRRTRRRILSQLCFVHHRSQRTDQGAISLCFVCASYNSADRSQHSTATTLISLAVNAAAMEHFTHCGSFVTVQQLVSHRSFLTSYMAYGR